MQKRSYRSSFSLVLWATSMPVNETEQDSFSESEGKRQSTAKRTELNPLLPPPYAQTEEIQSLPTPAQRRHHFRAPWVHSKEATLTQPWARACQGLGHSCLLGWTSQGPCVREYREFSYHLKWSQLWFEACCRRSRKSKTLKSEV